jgi:hypothetical protein
LVPQRTRISVATVALACLSAVLAAGCAGSDELTCADMVLVDWNNGRLGSTHAAGCYRDALDDLPEDARLYTTASEDIKRALRASLAAPRRERHERPATKGEASRRLSGRQRERTPPSAGAGAETSLPPAVALTVALTLAVGAAGVASSAARRRRVRR